MGPTAPNLPIPLLLASLGLALGGCTPTTLSFGDKPDGRDHEPGDTDTDTDSDTDTDTDSDTDTDTDTDTDADTDTDTDADTVDTGEVVYDCDALPESNLGDTNLSDARGYHGVAFDDDGNLIGWDGRTSLVKSAYDGTREVFVPGFRSVEQIDREPEGDFVLSDTANGRIVRITPEGGQEVVTSSSGSAYGVTVGPDRKIWIADGGIKRVDPTTGDIETILAQPRGWTAHSMNFNLDSTVLYIGSIGRGDLYALALDADLNPTGDPEVFARAGNGWHDAVGVDACGNIYVADYSSAGLYRVSPDGATVTPMVTGGNVRVYGHGLQWGSGKGGWREDSLYQPQPYGGNAIREVVIGVPNGDPLRTWNGESVPW